MRRFYIINSILFAALIFIGCKPTLELQPVRQPELPSKYENISVESNSTILRPQQFFSDVHLRKLIDSAIANNFDLQIASQRIKMAQSDVMLGSGALKPRVDVQVMTALRRYGLYTMDGAGNASTFILPDKIVPENLPDYFPSFQSSWEIDLWGKLKDRKKAAVSRFLASAEGKNLVLTNLISDIASSYYELQAVDETIRIINETIQLQEQAFDIVKAKKEAAVLNELAVKQFEAQLMSLQAFQVLQKQQAIELESRINTLCGAMPQKVDRSASSLNDSFNLAIQPGIPAALLENRADIRQAFMLMTAAKADVSAARAAFNPSLNITAGLGYQGFRPDLLFKTPESIAYGLVGAFAMPIFNRSILKAAFNSATATQQEALYQYSKNILQAYTEVYTELKRVTNLKEAYQLKSKEVDALSQSIYISEELFKTGRATYLEVLFAQQNTLKAKLELVETKKQELLTSINLYRSLGGGWR